MTNIITEKINIDKILKDSNKIMNYLIKKFKSPSRAYLSIKFAVIYFEEVMGLKLAQEEEEELRATAKDQSQDWD